MTRYIIIILFLLVLSLNLHGQYFYSHTYTEKSGLPSSKVYDAIQDKNGRMLFATRKGVAAFDSYEWMPIEGTYSGGNTTVRFKKDNDAKIWGVYNSSAISLYSIENDTAVVFENAIPPLVETPVSTDFDVIRSGDKYYFFITTATSGTRFFDGEKWQSNNFNELHPGLVINAVETFEDKFFIATRNGCFTMDIGGNITEIPFFKSSVVHAFYKKENSKLYILTSDAIYLKQGENFEKVTDILPFRESSDTYRFPFLADFEGIFIYGSGVNLFFDDLRRGIRFPLDEKNGAVARGGSSIYKDRENNIWITNLRGISKFNAFSILNIRGNDVFLEDEVTAIEPLNDKVTIAANPERFLVIKDYKIVKRTKKLNNPDNRYFRILDLQKDNTGRIWYAAEKMGFGYLDENLEPREFKLPVNENYLAYSVFQGNGDSLFFLTKSKLFLRSNGRFEEIPIKNDSGKEFNFRKLFKSDTGFPAIGTMMSGALLYDKTTGEYNSYYSGKYEDSRNIYSIYYDHDEIIVGSSSQLYRVDGDSLKPKLLGDVYLERPIYFIKKDAGENLWFGTENGAYKWNRVRLISYSVDDGLSGLETNRDAYYCDELGNSWIGTSQGLSVIDNVLDSINIMIPELIIDRLETSLRTIKFGPGLILKPEEDGFFVHAKNISFVHENDISFQVNLEGFDNEWYNFYQEETVPYAPFFDLKSGDYSINIKMYVGQNDLVASLKSPVLKIEDPFWDTLEFKLLLMFTMGCILILIVLYHRKNLYTGKLELEVGKREEEIKHSELRQQVIFKNNKTIMLVIEPQTLKVVESNKAAGLFYGFSEVEFQKLTLTEIELPDKENSNNALLNNPGKSGNYEAFHINKSGEKVPVEVIYSILPYKSGTLYFLIINDITERREIESAIRDSEEKYRSLVSNIQDGIFLISEGKLIFVNESLAEMVEYERHEILAKPFIHFIEESDKAFVLQNYQQRMNGEKTEDEYEVSLVARSGRRVFVNIHVGLFKFERSLAIMGTVKDITEKRANDEQLRILSTIVEQSPVSIILMDQNCSVTYVNPIFSSTTGYTSDEILGKPADIFRNYEKGQSEKIKHNITMGESWTGEMINVRKNGAKYWASVVISPIKNNEGEITHFVSLETDISFEKFALEEIKKNEKLLNSVLDNLPVILFVTDIRGNFALYRGGAIEGGGIGSSSYVGKSVFEIYKNIPEVLDDVNRAFKGERFTSVRDINDKVYETHYSTLTDGKGKAVGIIGVSYDVSERESTRQALIQAKEEAEKSDRLKSEFLAQVSHEIRTPINSIMSFASLIKEEVEKDITEDLRYGFQVIENGGLRLIRTIDLILNMSQIQTQTYSPRIERFNLVNDIFEILIKEMKYVAGNKGLELKFTNVCERDDVLGDKYTIFQIFNNLVDNAIKYTEQGEIEIKIYSEATYIYVDVKDTGIGMSKEFIKEIFRPFTQEETGYTRKYEGNGLGMALVKEYAQLNNAELFIESEKGKGTKITVKFAI